MVQKAGDRVSFLRKGDDANLWFGVVVSGFGIRLVYSTCEVRETDMGTEKVYQIYWHMLLNDVVYNASDEIWVFQCCEYGICEKCQSHSLMIE